MGFISVGYGNIVNSDRIIAVAASNTAPSKRIIQEARDNSRAIDVTQGRKTKSIIIMDSEHVILSALHTATLLARLEGINKTDAEDEALEDEEI